MVRGYRRVTSPSARQGALGATVERFGGVDIVVVAAGVFGASRPIAELTTAKWRDVMPVNVDAVAHLFSALHPLLRLSPVGGRVVVIGSKNVPAPGRGAASYSASKAALTQLCRVAALEWAEDGIRVNVVHPDAVSDTGLWTPALLEERAARYGLTVDEYKRRNLLAAEVTARDVARVVTALCSDTFRVTTGAQIPIGGATIASSNRDPRRCDRLDLGRRQIAQPSPAAAPGALAGRDALTRGS
jgi:NAD(P)-dependent dehydrogenase (short-subunit alcohol dehydrogenase family)